LLVLSAKFSGAYLVLLVVTAVVSEALRIKTGASLGLATTLGASFFAAWSFARVTKRPATSPEATAFAWRAFVGACLVSLVLVAGFLAFVAPAHEARAVLSLLGRPIYLLIALAGFVVVGGIQYLAIRFSFIWFAKLATKGAPLRPDPSIEATRSNCVAAFLE
jgi:hypothetical protein